MYFCVSPYLGIILLENRHDDVSEGGHVVSFGVHGLIQREEDLFAGGIIVHILSVGPESGMVIAVKRNQKESVVVFQRMKCSIGRMIVVVDNGNLLDSKLLYSNFGSYCHIVEDAISLRKFSVSMMTRRSDDSESISDLLFHISPYHVNRRASG